jgi:hypothetical protein
MMKWFLAFGGIALIVFGVLVFHSRNFHASILNEASEDFGRLSGISAPSDFSATYGNVTYAGSETGGVGAAVMLVTSTPSLGGGTLVMAIVIVHNDRHEALTIGPTNFKILDTGGNLYSAAAGNSFPGDETSISSVEGLNPGLTTLYSIYFQVPSNLSMDDLTLKYYFDTGAKFVAVPLKVNSRSQATQRRHQRTRRSLHNPALTARKCPLPERNRDLSLHNSHNPTPPIPSQPQREHNSPRR